jgi:molybdenum cofactor guanylyltransferase
MGADKATIEFNGRPLIAHSIEILREAGLPVLISGNRPDLENLSQTVNDLGSSRGPLGGICGALQVTSVTTAVFIPVDLPLLPPALITVMQEIAQVTGHAVVVPSVNGFVQTFPAVLNRKALPFLTAELEAGRGGCFAAFNAAASALGQQVHVVRTELLVQSGQLRHPDGLPAARWFFNINSASDLRRAQAFGTGNVGAEG